jgi:hypothetical protein
VRACVRACASLYVNVLKHYNMFWQYFASVIAFNELMCRVGQNRIYTPYMTVCMVISLPKIPYIHRIYMVLVLANPTHVSAPDCA